MKISLNKFDEEDLEAQNFVRIKSQKPKLTGKQSVAQLVSQTGIYADPGARFANADLNELYKMDYLDELIRGIKTGKEASVYLGRSSTGLVAVKLYTDLRVRSFKHDEAYRRGRFIGDARIEKAIDQGSQKGLDARQILWVQEEFRQMQHLHEHGVRVPKAIAVSGTALVMEFIGDARIEKAIDQGSQKGLDARQILWVQEEFRQMQHLHEHGVRVPKAIAVSGTALVMEFIGDEHGNPAPRISDLKLEREEAEEAFRQSVLNLRQIVNSGRVHGDYSTFNILWHNEQAVVIDFPQVMDFKKHPNAPTFLQRDVHSLCKSFRKQGVKADEVIVLKQIRAG